MYLLSANSGENKLTRPILASVFGPILLPPKTSEDSSLVAKVIRLLISVSNNPPHLFISLINNRCTENQLLRQPQLHLQLPPPLLRPLPLPHLPQKTAAKNARNLRPLQLILLQQRQRILPCPQHLPRHRKRVCRQSCE